MRPSEGGTLSLIDGVGVGDYVLVHAGFAIDKLNPQSAEESVQEIRNHIKNVENGI